MWVPYMALLTFGNHLFSRNLLAIPSFLSIGHFIDVSFRAVREEISRFLYNTNVESAMSKMSDI